MCIGIWTLEHPEYALILCTNRDEVLHRPTQNAHFHSFANDIINTNSTSAPAPPVISVDNDDSGHVLSGRDVDAGGSWFGISRSGRVALLTNISETNGVRKYRKSRGVLVSSFLLSNSPHPLKEDIGTIGPEDDIDDAKFAGFNLLLLAPVLDDKGLIEYESLFVTNHGGGGMISSRALYPCEHSCGCMSNGIDGAGADLWPKVQHGRESFDALLQSLNKDATESELAEKVFELLAWHPEYAIEQLQELKKTVHVLPKMEETEKKTQTVYYGTRLSTVLLVKKNGDVLFIERDIWKLVGGVPVKPDPPTQRLFRFKLDVKKGGE